VGETTFGVGQITSMTQTELDSIKDKLVPYMQKALSDHDVGMIFFMLTNILQASTELLYAGSGARELAEASFHHDGTEESIILGNTVSRKKQIIPAMMIELQEEI